MFEVQFDVGRLHGRVIRTDALITSSAPGLNLLYFYNDLTSQSDLETVDLAARNLLIPPVLTNNLGWTRGFYRTIARRPLGPGEILAQHCFDAYGAGYYDEYGSRLPGPVEPVGLQAVRSYLTIEDELAGALGWV